MAKITIYTTPTCPWCTKLKDWLEEEGIDYKEVDVSQDAEAVKEMMAKTGQRVVPLSTIGDETIVGFDPDKIKDLLK